MTDDIEDIEDVTPTCPRCDGDGCGLCKGAGWMARADYEAWYEEVGA